jgi:hypothetical protein
MGLRGKNRVFPQSRIENIANLQKNCGSESLNMKEKNHEDIDDS